MQWGHQVQAQWLVILAVANLTLRLQAPRDEAIIMITVQILCGYNIIPFINLKCHVAKTEFGYIQCGNNYSVLKL